MLHVELARTDYSRREDDVKCALSFICCLRSWFQIMQLLFGTLRRCQVLDETIPLQHAAINTFSCPHSFQWHYPLCYNQTTTAHMVVQSGQLCCCPWFLAQTSCACYYEWESHHNDGRPVQTVAAQLKAAWLKWAFRGEVLNRETSGKQRWTNNKKVNSPLAKWLQCHIHWQLQLNNTLMPLVQQM